MYMIMYIYIYIRIYIRILLLGMYINVMHTVNGQNPAIAPIDIVLPTPQEFRGFST